MGAGSGTSPAISSDGSLVYAADGEGHLLAVDAESGAVQWRADGVQGAASPSVGPDGTVYSFSGSEIVALEGATGEHGWSRSYDDLAERLLPAPAFGRLRANVDSLLSLTDGPGHPILWACINLGPELPGPRPFALPQLVVVAAIDARDGRVLGTTPIRDTSSAFVVPGPGGRLYVSLAGVTTSSIYYAGNDRLPEALRLTSAPKAGLVALAPVPSE
jgi:outer membrane protein assembly factor BamB